MRRTLFIIAALLQACYLLPQSGCTQANYQTAFLIPPTSFPYFSPGSGITVSVQTNVTNYTNFTYNCGGLPYACSNPAWGLTMATHYIRLIFSAPVTNISVVVNGTNQTEVFYNAAGTGAVTVMNHCSPDFIASTSTMTDMVVPAVGSLMTLNNPTGSTTYTLTHNGLGAGSRVTLLDCIVPLNLLPIELASFEAACTNKDEAELKWKVTGGRTLGTLYIEKSSDGENWSTLTTYEQNELDRDGEYTYTDVSQENAVRYYRLKHTNAEGHFKYSQTVLAGNCHKKENTITVYPNPAGDVLNVKGQWIGPAQLLDPMGNVILSVPQAGNEALLNTSALEKGIYFLRAGDHSRKIIKD